MRPAPPNSVYDEKLFYMPIDWRGSAHSFTGTDKSVFTVIGLSHAGPAKIGRGYEMRGLVLRETDHENGNVYTRVGKFGWDSPYLTVVTGENAGRAGLDYLRLKVPRQVIQII